MIAHLTYFKPTGKYYSQGELEVGDFYALWLIWDDVRELRNKRALPGLIQGHDDYIVSVDVPDHPDRHPHLIMLDSLR